MTEKLADVKRWVKCKVWCLEWLDRHSRTGWWIAFWGLLNIVVTLVS